MLTDYKHPYVIRYNGGTTEAKAHFFEGDITAQMEEVEQGVFKSVTRYRRTRMIREVIIKRPASLSDDELHGLLNTELAKDTTRTPIDEQKVTAALEE